jgi:hypothetical protein
MPQGHNTVGGVWEGDQMVFPSLSPIVAIHRGEATNPSFVANVVDPVRHGHSLFKMMQVTFAKLQCQDLALIPSDALLSSLLDPLEGLSVLNCGKLELGAALNFQH